MPVLEDNQTGAIRESGDHRVEFDEGGGLLRSPEVQNGPEIHDFRPVFYGFVGWRWLPFDGPRTEFGHSGPDANVCLLSTHCARLDCEVLRLG